MMNGWLISEAWLRIGMGMGMGMGQRGVLVGCGAVRTWL